MTLILEKFSLLFLVTVLIFNGKANAQNMIPNPSFEEWDGTNITATLSGLDHWYSANGTADHHHEDTPGSNLSGLEPCPTGEGNEWCGVAHSGQAVLGAWKGNGPDGSKEWGGVKMIEPMVAGNCYEVSFWINNKEDNPDALYETNQWGMMFSETQYPFFNANLADFSTMTDQFVTCEEVIGGSEWQKVEFLFYANEPYEYAYIGYMGNVSNATYTAANDDYLLGFYVWFDDVVVQPIDQPELTLTPDLSLCQGDSILLQASSNYPVTWNDGMSFDTEIWVKPEFTTTYYIQTLDSTACSIRDSIVVSVIGDTVIDFMDASICVGADAFVLDDTVEPGTWSGTGITDPNQGLFDPAVSGVGLFEVNYVSNADCAENFTMNVEVLPPPTVDFEADVLEGCPPLAVQFQDISPVPGLTYEWKFGDGTTSDQALSSSHTYSQTGSYDVSLSVDYSEHCTSRQTIEGFIEVHDFPVADFSIEPQEPSNVEPEVTFMDQSTGEVAAWSWNFDGISTSTDINPVHEYKIPGIYDVSLAVTSIHGCTDSVVQQVKVNSIVKIYTPNAFSPNDDGINDTFEVFPKGLLEDYKITVFNRWGGVIFESEDLNTHWDGDLPNGDEADIGIYTYFIEYIYQGLEAGASFSGIQTGDVLIVR